MKASTPNGPNLCCRGTVAVAALMLVHATTPAAENVQARVCVDRAVVDAFYRLVARFEMHPLVVGAKKAVGQDPETIFRFTMIMAQAPAGATRFTCTALGVRVEPAPFTDAYEVVASNASGASFASEWAARAAEQRGMALALTLAEPGNWETKQDFQLEKLDETRYRVSTRYRIVGDEEFSEVVTVQRH